MLEYRKWLKRVDFFYIYFLDNTIYTAYSIDKRNAHVTDKNGCGYSRLIELTTVFDDGAHSTCDWMGFFHAPIKRNIRKK